MVTMHIYVKVPFSLLESIREGAARMGMSRGQYFRHLAEKDRAEGMKLDVAVAERLRELIENGQVHGVTLKVKVTNLQGGTTDD